MKSAAAGQDVDPSDSLSEPLPHVMEIAAAGDVVLDVTFEYSKQTLRSAKKAASLPRPEPMTAGTSLKPRARVAYRVSSSILKKQSNYFSNLLGDTRFEEARAVHEALAKLSLRNLKPAQADVKDLPWITILDGDEATRSAGRESGFGDLLRILHGQETITKPPTLLYVTILAVLADRFGCVTAVSRYVSTGLKFKWPRTKIRDSVDDPAPLNLAAEEVLRQKILVSWLLDDPLKLRLSSRELILRGSRRWSAYADEHETTSAMWWDLPDDLERELQYRRECILNTIASVQRHFFSLYTSRSRQCTLGYDSSVSCDSYQLGEMVKFLSSKGLLFLVDFSPRSLETVPDIFTMEIGQLIATLKQCPSYQIDKNHTNCGLRTRILPILDFIETALASNVISISPSSWKEDRAGATWYRPSDKKHGPADVDVEGFTFRPTGSYAYARLQFPGLMGVDNVARQMFTATAWEWTPEI